MISKVANDESPDSNVCPSSSDEPKSEPPTSAVGPIPATRVFDGAKTVADLWSLLPAFYAVAQEGGVRRAAYSLGRNASCITRAIAELEREAAAPLFRRTEHGMELTGAGHALLAATSVGTRVVEDALESARCRHIDEDLIQRIPYLREEAERRARARRLRA